MSFIHQVKPYGSNTAQFLRENKTLFFLILWLLISVYSNTTG